MAGKNLYNPGKRFVNPYNFIPLMEKCERSDPELRSKDCYTGYFDCRLKLLTPLFIPNTSCSSRLLMEEERKGEWKGYDFFSYDDWPADISANSWSAAPESPVIPGSEIRGAVRSVYEAAFNGCMSSVSVDRTFSRRSSIPKSPGILKQENGEWIIQPCETAMLFVKCDKMKNFSESMGIDVPLETYNLWKEGQEIWIKLRKDEYKKKSPNGKNISIGKVVEAYKIIEESGISYYNNGQNKERFKLKNSGYEQGWLHKGEAISNKHHKSVFYHCGSSNKEIIKVKHPSDIEGLKKILQEYRDIRKNRAADKNDIWYTEYEILPEGTLVYYSKTKDGKVYLSPARIGREAFSKTVGALLKNNGGYEPCNGKELCPSCRIFGMVGKNGTGGTFAWGSKVRVTDAQLTHTVGDHRELFEKPIILPELGEPKPCAVEFYTKSPYESTVKDGKGYWTYDYKIECINGYLTNERLPLGPNSPKLRGRKFYWHSEVDISKFQDKEFSAMKQRIRPMKAQKLEDEPLFGFRVYFEQLGKEQIKQLKWALDFGNPDCAHKIGRAKPLGFGSVRITADKLYLRTIDTDIDTGTGIWTIKEMETEQFFEKSVLANEAIKTVQLMANWKDKPENVQYPWVKLESKENKAKKNSTASHQWFTKNKKPISNPNFSKVLPEANEEALKDLEQKKALLSID